MSYCQDVEWYAVHTKPRRENVAAAHIAARQMEVLLPLALMDAAVGGVIRCIARPLFPGYLFARFCVNVSLDTIRHTQGVVRVVSAGDRPLAVAPEIVGEIRERIGSDGLVHLGRRRLECGEVVQIEAGPFSGWMGRVERELNEGRCVMILLEVLQQARLVMERHQLSPLTA